MSYGANAFGSPNYMGSHWTDRILMLILSDAMSASFSDSKAVTLAKSKSISPTDLYSGLLVKNQALTSSSSITESFAKNSGFYKSQEESILSSIVGSQLSDIKRSFDTSMITSATMAGTNNFKREAAASCSVAISILNRISYSRALAESLGITDSKTLIAFLNRSLTESLSLSQSSPIFNVIKQLTFSSAISDVITKNYIKNLSNAQISFSDAIILGQYLSFSKSFSVSDSLIYDTRTEINNIESLTLTKSISKIYEAYKNDSNFLSESSRLESGVQQDETDTFSVADSNILNTVKGISDIISSSDENNKDISSILSTIVQLSIDKTINNVFAREFSDSVSTISEYNKIFSKISVDSLSMSDEMTQLYSIGREIADAISFSETSSSKYDAVRSLEAAAAIIESLSKDQVSQIVSEASLTDFLTIEKAYEIADSVEPSVYYVDMVFDVNKIFEESILHSDSVNSDFKKEVVDAIISGESHTSDTIKQIISDISASDENTRTRGLDISSSFQISESVSIPVQYSRNFPELVSILESFEKQSQFYIEKISSINIAESHDEAIDRVFTLSDQQSIIDSIYKIYEIRNSAILNIAYAIAYKSDTYLFPVDTPEMTDLLQSQSVTYRNLADQYSVSDIVGIERGIDLLDNLSMSTTLSRLIYRRITRRATVLNAKKRASLFTK